MFDDKERGIMDFAKFARTWVKNSASGSGSDETSSFFIAIAFPSFKVA